MLIRLKERVRSYSFRTKFASLYWGHKWGDGYMKPDYINNKPPNVDEFWEPHVWESDQHLTCKFTCSRTNNVHLASSQPLRVDTIVEWENPYTRTRGVTTAAYWGTLPEGWQPGDTEEDPPWTVHTQHPYLLCHPTPDMAIHGRSVGDKESDEDEEERTSVSASATLDIDDSSFVEPTL